MTATSRLITLSPRDYDAALFDLDGVVTKTARVHAAAWKHLFDEFLEARAATSGEPFVPFDIDVDYRRYVDGKPRAEGVASFLRSRNIELPLGNPEDGPDVRTVHGLGNRKDQYFLQELREHGVERYETTIELVRTLRSEDVKTYYDSRTSNGSTLGRVVHLPAERFHNIAQRGDAVANVAFGQRRMAEQQTGT